MDKKFVMRFWPFFLLTACFFQSTQAQSIPEIAPWPVNHSDNRNSDFTPFLLPTFFQPAWQIDTSNRHTIAFKPVIGGYDRLWSSISVSTIPATGAYTGINTTSGALEYFNSTDVNSTSYASQAVIDPEGNSYLSQEKLRATGTSCVKYEGQSGFLCGELLSFDRNGQLRWRIDIDGVALGGQLLIGGTSSGNIPFVFQTWRGTIYVVDRNTGQKLASLNSFPSVAQTLPNDFTNVGSECLTAGTGNSCITANTPATYAIASGFAFYNTVQGIAIGQVDGFVQRWNVSETISPVAPFTASYTITAAANWIRANLPNGSASSTDLSLDGSTLFVCDAARKVYALNTSTGSILTQANLSYTPIGSPITAPENSGSTLILFNSARAPEVPYLTLMRFTPGSTPSFQTLAILTDWKAYGTGVAGLSNTGKPRFIIPASRTTTNLVSLVVIDVDPVVTTYATPLTVLKNGQQTNIAGQLIVPFTSLGSDNALYINYSNVSGSPLTVLTQKWITTP